MAAYGSVQGPLPDAGKFFLDMPGSGFAPAGDREMFHYPADLKILPGPFLDVRLKGGGRTCSLSRRKLRASRAENAQWGRGLAIFYASYALVFACWWASLTYGVPFPCRLVSTGRRRVSSHAVYGGMRVCCVASASDASRRARLTGKVRKVPSIICPVGRKFSCCHRFGPICF